jgi:hypothetical protein
MRISSASFLIDGCKKWNSLFWSLQFRIWEWILTRVYRLFPTQIGTIDEDLESDIRDGLLYAGVRFRTFNNSFGSFVFYGAFLLLLMFLIGVPAILLPPSSPEIFQIVGTLVLGIAGVLLVLSMILIGFADLLLLLYIASLLRFVLQKIQPSVSHPEDTSPSVYISKRIDLTDGSETSIKVYKSNLESVFRFSVFLLLCLILPVLHFFSELLVRPAKNLLNIAAMQKISELSYIPEIDGLLESLDALLPIELKVLVSPESAPFLKLLIFSLLLFSAFINWKKV